MLRIQCRQNFIPVRSQHDVSLWSERGVAQLAQKFLRSLVGEAQIRRREVLVQNGRAEESPHLLLFDGVARRGQCVSASCKNGARDLPVQRGKKR
jgi:hypothetical protein